ncbi:MAG: aminomethyl-transferring glycine dehydrogenase subunit GcvPA [Phycisphaerales bacterium]|jgi:glycine dehydrogenase subunit 1|nr:aminomethyl-transferring glycine dehydrogenase subunit GcvPA [Phycisphaerales bacterium]
MPFIANTDQQRQEMLAAIGVDKVEDLFANIPPELRCKGLDIPPGLTEQEVRKRMADLAEHNSSGLINFLGGGFYDHFIPAALNTIVSRSEFYTAYTPYQPEISQGTLQAIYEYQSAICRLTGMEAANASLYDGGTAVYEAIMMALRITKRSKVLVDDSVSPIYRKMVKSYTSNLGIDLMETASREGLPDRNAIADQIDDDTAAVIVQNPNFFGCIDDVTDLAEMVHARGGLLIVSCYPISLGLLKTPGEMNADIVVGEGQSLGMSVSFGGPYLGFMATRKKYLRKMPGRVVGRTVDAKGRDGFVLTLQAREQHIRREKATSNICTNQGLCALTSLVYMSLLGKHGLAELSGVCAHKADYARELMLKIPGVTIRFPERWYFNEFVLNLPMAADKVIRGLFNRGLAAGFPLGRYFPEMNNCLLVAVTENRTKEEIDFLAHSLEVIL